MPGSIRATGWTLSSGTAMALLIGGGLLIIAFMINETVARRPWAHFNVLFSRNIGLSLIVILAALAVSVVRWTGWVWTWTA